MPEQVTAPVWRPPVWQRLLVVHAVQLVPLLLAVTVASRGAVIGAALLGSVICCLGTDSGWRWLNRLLVLEAVLWLLLGLWAIG